MNKAAFKYFLKIKEGHTKLNETIYTEFVLQPYLTTKLLNKSEKKLLYLLRSKCHSAKNNFRKLHKSSVQCIFQCSENEDQRHAFSHCQSIIKKIDGSDKVQYEQIFGPLHEQRDAIRIFSKIDQLRNHTIKKHLLPGGSSCQDPCTFEHVLNGATDTISALLQ